MPITKKHAGIGGIIVVTTSLVAFIHAREGVKYIPYRDSVGVLTVCGGVTGKHVIAGKRYTPEECDALDRGEIEKHGQALLACIDKPITQNQYEALASWAYNVGTGAACGSSLVRHINEGKPPQVFCNDLMDWDRAGGNVLQGLKNRREVERALCLKDS